MLTFEKVMEVFGDYLSEDKSCEILLSSRGYLVVDWESKINNWVTTQLCPTPEYMRDVLRSCYEEYQGYLLTRGKRDITDREEQEVHRKAVALADKCNQN